MSEDQETSGQRPEQPTAGAARPPSRASSPETATPRGDHHAANGSKSSATMMRLASAGLELASFSLILGAAGYWLDNSQDHATPYFGIAGVLIGFTLAMYRLIRLAAKIGNN